jgi:FkbH-like protein
MEQIKLVIWDLDETFWKGTLSEEGVQIIQQNIDIIKTLTNRGIINSIVSKNNYEITKKKLEEIGVWYYFVYPQIQWEPKGQLISKVISDLQLRDINVLFLDDNYLNLEEAKFYNEKINIANPEFTNIMLEHPSFKGKNDFDHSRLKQYKILENKISESKKFSNNQAFLEQSDIQLRYIFDLDKEKTRIHELINRTNQLNFTKKRISLDELDNLLTNKECFKSFGVEVRDKYGDYGIVGFVSTDLKLNKLEHFLFSCRTINLGIEQFVYADLKFPELKIVGDVAAKLDNSRPHWITHGFKDSKIFFRGKNKFNKAKILLKGGCDLSQMNNYLLSKNIHIEEEMNYVLENNNSVHREHTIMLRNCEDLNSEVKKYLVDTIPFIDENSFVTNVFKQDYDVLVYSLLMDYTQEIYRNVTNNAEITFGGYKNVMTMDSDLFEKTYIDKNIFEMNSSFHKEFKSNFVYLGQISPERFIENLKYIRNKIDKPIIFINGTEVGKESNLENGSLARHKVMNFYLEEFISKNEDTYLLDLRKIIKKD